MSMVQVSFADLDRLKERKSDQDQSKSLRSNEEKWR